MANPDKIERKWYVVDAEGCTLGRLASGVASVLRGKNKPQFTPHVDTGDYVIIVNADKVKVTGKKMDQKIYYHHSDYVGGMKETTLKEMMAKKPSVHQDSTLPDPVSSALLLEVLLHILQYCCNLELFLLQSLYQDLYFHHK